jgi:hypothetical protein
VLIWLFVIDARSERHQVFEGGENLEYQEEDQGQADQGKPSKLVAYLILVLVIACFINIYENACFIHCYYLSIAIVGDLAPRVNCYHPHG